MVTFFTFLPSFFFILLGGPFIESTHGNLKFTAPLVGITAAVVGVIVNLAVFFAYHVLWPQGLDGPASNGLPPSSGSRPPSRCSASRLASFPWCWLSGVVGLALRLTNLT